MTLIDEGLELLDDDECWRLLRSALVGRVGVSVGALPAIFPVNYEVVDDTIVFCTSPGTKLAAAAREAVVAFEVDEYDAATATGWSVHAVGKAREVVDPDALAEVSRAGRGPWVQWVRSHLVQIRPVFLTGRRIVHGA